MKIYTIEKGARQYMPPGAYAGGGFGGLNEVAPPLWYFYVCKPP